MRRLRSPWPWVSTLWLGTVLAWAGPLPVPAPLGSLAEVAVGLPGAPGAALLDKPAPGTLGLPRVAVGVARADVLASSLRFGRVAAGRSPASDLVRWSLSHATSTSLP